MDIRILYEDNHLLVVVKPPDMPVQADISGALDLLTYLKQDLKVRYNKPGNVFLGLVHRLDRPVGGTMVFAKTSKAASRLSEQIRNREMVKTYLCVVQGVPEPLKGRLTDYLLKDRNSNIVKVVNPDTRGAKKAVLEYEVLSQAQGLSLVEINLITGRSHQIRVQMSHNHTPLVGDNKYGNKLRVGAVPSTNKDNQIDNRGRGIGLSLWSHKVEIKHPTTKERMLFTSSPPDSFPWNLFKQV